MLPKLLVVIVGLMILFGVEALPVLGFAFRGFGTQTGKVHVKEGRCGKGKTNHERLVARMVELLRKEKEK